MTQIIHASNCRYVHEIATMFFDFLTYIKKVRVNTIPRYGIRSKKIKNV
jgi:hypothetical protein